ncbi:hypothetical protein ASG40_18155 [Methylobacterium sp. Leaf399]|uniref:hypothetical protein n=1 Tax=Methylobacterium sp. Leaf399 TaxID=1736364 RepID=UPI0006F3C6E7|nr:hypothetical protein [Methylobacterium sp. Leaf399]KQT16164.1 hypothetical protein ASG40_18155 [Methylobacterium sp. Leaf399]
MAQQSTTETVWSALIDIEDDVANVRRWSQVLYAMGASGSSVDPEALSVIAGAVDALAERLQARWDHAMGLARAHR